MGFQDFLKNPAMMWDRDGAAAHFRQLDKPSIEDYQQLQQALIKVAHLDSLPKWAPRKKLGFYLDRAGCPRQMSNTLLNVYSDRSGRGVRRIKAIECKIALDFFKKQGILAYGQPILAFAGHEDMLFHAVAAQTGGVDTHISLKEDEWEVYEMYTMDVAQVLSEQGRYYLLCGYMGVKREPLTGVVQSVLRQPSGAPPGAQRSEYYEGHFVLQDDTAYVSVFRSPDAIPPVEPEKVQPLFGMTDDDDDDEPTFGGRAKRLFSRSKSDAKDKDASNSKFPPGMRRNMASLILSGYSRNRNGLYDKFLGGQIGRGLTGAAGIFSSPCVLYRVTDERARDIDEALKEERDPLTGRDTVGLTKSAGPVSSQVKLAIMERFVGRHGMVDILDGVHRPYATVMSDLGIPIPLPEERYEPPHRIIVSDDEE